MKNTIIASVLLALMTFLAISNCYALDMASNGYAWNSADDKEKVALCKTIAGKYGKSYKWWIILLDNMYDRKSFGFHTPGFSRGF
jgi:hypothetical protein